jgi:hypothetical protein
MTPKEALAARRQPQAEILSIALELHKYKKMAKGLV